MDKRTTLLALIMSLATLPAFAQAPSYHIEKEQIEKDGRATDRLVVARRPDKRDKPTLFVTVQFKILRPDGSQAEDVLANEIVVLEDGSKVTDLEIHAPAAQESLTTVLAIDISGSMAEHGKMEEAKRAARTFLDRLNPKAQCGLILFDHQIRVQERPTGDREQLRRLIDAAKPGGGTAYLDATAAAIEMLRNIKGRRAVLLMTDGIDLNSRKTLKDVIRLAGTANIPVYTVGVGEPGKNTPITTVLVLDHSGSMEEPADNHDRIRKIDALKNAASRFVDIMRPGARTTLLPFNNIVEIPKPFTENKEMLKSGIRRLKADGGTSLYDATYDAVETLVASRLEGKKVVVVLTDGVDEEPGSNHRVEEVIDAAKEAGIPLHTLGLGRDGEIDERVMRRMADQTGGKYHHARTGDELFEIFEDLSIQLYDEGIDEATLRQLADDTGGKYFPAQDISQLRLIYEGLAQELQTTYTVTFPSLQQDNDGTSRVIDITVWKRGTQVSDVLRSGYNVEGVVVPEMDTRVYLGLLLMLGGLLILPAGMKRLSRPAAPGNSATP